MYPVTHVITTIEMGGAEKQLLILAASQANSGRKVRVCYLKGNPELANEFTASGVTVMDQIANKNFFVQLYLLRKIQFDKNEVVHAHLPQAELTTALAGIARKLIITRHNSEPFWPRKPRVVSSMLSRFVCFRADAVIAISNAVRDYVIGRGEVSSKVAVDVVYYGFNSEVVKRTQHGSSLIFGTISRLTEQKDIPTMLKAFALFSRVHSEAELYIVGEGHLRAQLIEFAQELEIQNRVTWLGRTSEINAFLESLDVFLLSSRYEGFGMVLLEAISRSVPIIASNSGAVIEVLGEESPSLFPVGDYGQLAHKMNQVQNSAFRARIAESNLSRMNLFTVSKMLDSLNSIYSRTV
jgi:glycosyltransferase involved in cell wall biosynthesis